MSMAAQNGHVKVEKRLWLFNWNLDLINKNDKQKRNASPTAIMKISEKQREIREIKTMAQEYQQQFKTM